MCIIHHFLTKSVKISERVEIFIILFDILKNFNLKCLGDSLLLTLFL